MVHTRVVVHVQLHPQQNLSNSLMAACNVAGMVGGMLRHMRSLRTMKRDHGRIHTLLEEAENERMHLLTFLQISQPGLLTRMGVLLTQVWRGSVHV